MTRKGGQEIDVPKRNSMKFLRWASRRKQFAPIRDRIIPILISPLAQVISCYRSVFSRHGLIPTVTNAFSIRSYRHSATLKRKKIFRSNKHDSTIFLPGEKILLKRHKTCVIGTGFFKICLTESCEMYHTQELPKSLITIFSPKVIHSLQFRLSRGFEVN